MAQAKAQKQENNTVTDYAKKQLSAVGTRPKKELAEEPKRKRTKKAKCNAADVIKLLEHEKEWCNKPYKWIAKRMNRTPASVRTVISALREQGHYPRTLHEMTVAALQK